MKKIATVLLLILIIFTTKAQLISVSCYSPDSKIKLDVFSYKSEMFYKVYKNNALVIDTSQLGLWINGTNNFAKNLQFV